MFKKYLSILMLYSALAIMLGHNFIPHHHHFEQSTLSHHDHDHDHDGAAHNHDSHDSDEEPSDWGHLFSNFHHGSSGLIFYSSTLSIGTYAKKDTQTPQLYYADTCIEPEWVDIRQNAPLYLSPYYNSHYYLQIGLRAPPSHIV